MKLSIKECLAGEHKAELNQEIAKIDGWYRDPVFPTAWTHPSGQRRYQLHDYIDSLDSLGRINLIEERLDFEQKAAYKHILGQNVPRYADLPFANALYRVVSMIEMINPRFFF